MRTKVKVSVIIPSYNRAHTLPRALDSVKNQTYRPLEIIVVDDGSTDKTCNLIGSYDSNDISIILICNNQNLGIGISRNNGIKAASGKYIALLDSDDEWIDPKKIEKQVNFLEKNLQYSFVGGGWLLEKNNLIDTKGPLFESDIEFRNIALTIYPVHTSTWLFRKEIINKIGYFWGRKNEDYEFILRIGKYFLCYCLSDIVTRYNNAGSGDRKSNKFKSFIYSLYIIYIYRKYYPFFFKAVFDRFKRVILKITNFKKGNKLYFL